jgi:PhnB protein
MAGDAVVRGKTISLMLYCTTEDGLRSYFARLSKGETVNTEPKVEFWQSMYGDITDKFGMMWMLNYEKPKA